MEDEMMNKMGRVMFESTVAFVKTMVRVNGKQASVAMMMANQEKLFKGSTLHEHQKNDFFEDLERVWDKTKRLALSCYCAIATEDFTLGRLFKHGFKRYRRVYVRSHIRSAWRKKGYISGG